MILFVNKNIFTLPLRFTGCYTKDEPNFPRQNNLILQRRQGCEFQGVSTT